MEVPTELRVHNGRLVLKDGSDATAYLDEKGKTMGLTPNVPIAILKSSDLQKLIDFYYNTAA